MSRTIGGREPIGAHTYSSDPFCPTLASSGPAAHYQLTKLGHLRLVQQRQGTHSDPRLQTRYAISVMAMHPVAQRLAIHAVHLCRFCARAALQDQRQRKQPPHDLAVPSRALAVLLARGNPAQISRRMIRVRDDDRLTHDDPPAPESAQATESQTASGGNPPRESRPEVSGITPLFRPPAPLSLGCRRERPPGGSVKRVRRSLKRAPVVVIPAGGISIQKSKE